MSESASSSRGKRGRASPRGPITGSVLLVVAALGAWGGCAPPPEEANLEAERLVHLLGHLASDYGRAVANGAVLSWDEYDEALELAEQADQLAARLAVVRSRSRGREDGPRRARAAEVGTPAAELRALIEGRAPEAEVARVAAVAIERVLAAFPVERVPRARPERARGAAAFAEMCAPCHGESGRADTALAAEMRPPPANFHDPAGRESLTPARVASALRFGVGDTAMPAFASLSDQERWSLAFTVLALPHAAAPPLDGELPDLSLEDLATRSDTELSRDLEARGVAPERRAATLAALRREAPFDAGGAALADSAPRGPAPGGSITSAAVPALAAVIASVVAAVVLRRPRFRRARALLTAILAVLVVLAIVAGAVLSRRDAAPSPSPSASAAPTTLTVRVRAKFPITRGTARLLFDGGEHWARFGANNEATFAELPALAREAGAARLQISTEPELEASWEPARLFPLDGPLLEVFARPERPMLGVRLLYRAGGGDLRNVALERLNVPEEATIAMVIAGAVAAARVTTADVPAASRFTALSYRVGRWLRPAMTIDHLDDSEVLVILVDEAVRAERGEAKEAYFAEVAAAR